MLKFCSLYSGSRGNSLLVQSVCTKISVDAGESAKKIENALSSIAVDIASLDGILVTHEHTDHVKSLGTISRKYNIPVFANRETWDAMPKQKDKIEEKNQKNFQVTEKLTIGDIEIIPFSIPHDAANPCGFNIWNNSTKLSIATDLGHMTKDILTKLENSSFLLLESNYDPEILKLCSYPYVLKERISGPNGHLSNITAGKTISYLLQTGLKNVMLGHLSKENNFPELAYQTVAQELMSNHYDENTFSLSVASRFCPSKVIDVTN